jgi:hypothetical protein
LVGLFLRSGVWIPPCVNQARLQSIFRHILEKKLVLIYSALL